MIRLVTSALLLAASGFAYAQDAPRSKSGNVDLAIVAGDRPLLIRLHLTVDGKPLALAWRTHMEKWFQFLDRDGNGLLDEKEIAHAPVPLAMLQILRQGNYFFGAGAGIQPGTVGNERGATLGDFMAYYMDNDAGPISFSPTFPYQDPQSQQLFAQLDRNKDGKLSKEELEAAPLLLKKLDVDDDETVSAVELSGPNAAFAMRPNGTMGMRGPPANSVANVFPLGSKNGMRQVFDRCDQDKDGKLTPTEFAIDRKKFDLLDMDHDGTLSFSELRKWIDLPPDAEWDTVWDGPFAKLKSGSLNSLQIGPMEMQYVPLTKSLGPRPVEYYITDFRSADVSKKGYVTNSDLKQPQHQILQRMFSALDRDADGKLTQKELWAFVDLQRDALSSHVTLSFTDQGRGLFQMLDTDRDGRLSARELRVAWTRLESHDKNRDGAIDASEIPSQCTLAAGFGFQALTYRPGIQFTGVAAPRPVYAEGTPQWFIKMDINGDGEVSPREFLGSAADFRRLDADGDGMISAAEAIRFKK